MRSAHMTAFLARANGITPPGYDSEAPLNPNGTLVRGSYFVVWDVGPDSLDDQRLTARQRYDSAGDYRFVTKAVGVDANAARAVHDALAAQLIGHRLVVAGRTCDPIRLDARADAVERDTSVSPPLYFIEADWIVPSQRGGS